MKGREKFFLLLSFHKGRLEKETDRVENFIRDTLKPEKMQEIVDTKRLWQDWDEFKAIKNNEYDVAKVHHLLRTVSAAHFMGNF